MGKSLIFNLPNIFVFLLWMMMIHLTLYQVEFCDAAAVGCRKPEQEALLKFKDSAEGSSFHLPSWIGEDCCKWSGVGCDNVTGNVIKLRPQNDPHFEPAQRSSSTKQSSISPALLELRHLTHLDLSGMNFSGQEIPEFIGSMHQLRYLNLSNAEFHGEVPSTLGNLTNLEVLDLSDNEYETYGPQGEIYALYVESLSWVSNLRRLWHLNLSLCELFDQITNIMQVLNHLPRLSVLQLRSCHLFDIPLPSTFVSNSTNLSTLHHFDLSDNIIIAPLPPILGNLSSLRFLDLSMNAFKGEIPLSLGNIKGLQFLYLDNNRLSHHVEGGIWGLLGCRLKVLDLSENEIQGEMLEESLNTSRCAVYDLELLHLSKNQIKGKLPSLGGKLNKLKELKISDNSLSGMNQNFLGELTELEMLDISSNSIQGTISHIGNLSKLSYLDISYNEITLNFSSEWLPPFQLLTFKVASCKIIHPQWLHTQNRIQDLDLSDTGIMGSMSKWIQNMTDLRTLNLSNNFLTGPLPQEFTSPRLEKLDIHENSLSGTIPNWLGHLEKAIYLDLSSNQFSGFIPSALGYNCTALVLLFLSRNSLDGPIPSTLGNCSSLIVLDLSENKLYGEIPSWAGENLPQLQFLRLQKNNLGLMSPGGPGDDESSLGTIPKSLSQLSNLYVLDLQSNMLGGEIPDCWNNSGLQVINLSSNKLSGVIPCSLGQMYRLEYLHLNGNRLNGRIPSCISKLPYLRTLDLGENELIGEMPTWPSEQESLAFGVLRLAHNRLNGSIPKHLCYLYTLHVIDLSNNQFTGNIPSCLGNISGFNHPAGSDNVMFEYPFTQHTLDTLTFVENSINETITGIVREYSTIINYLSVIDLSGNRLVGSIPENLTMLSGLMALNLSYNHLTGKIPEKIGDMKSLQTLDLSGNKLFGKIPSNLGNLDFINHLNLSNNNFSGPIPTSRHLETLDDPSIYAGNPYLCGDFLPKKCESHDKKPDDHSENQDVDDDDDDKESKNEKMWFYLVVMLGFATGFWGVIGTLILKIRWRRALFGLVEDASDWLYMSFAVNLSKIKLLIKQGNPTQ